VEVHKSKYNQIAIKSKDDVGGTTVSFTVGIVGWQEENSFVLEGEREGIESLCTE